MDNVNSKIGQGVAREAASILNEKSFSANNLVGFSSGVSQFTRSDNVQANQQVKNTEKTLVSLSQEQANENDKKRKANRESADNIQRDSNLSFSQSLSKINEVMQTNGTKISFTLDDSAKELVITVTDKDSGNVIRQIPSEEMQKFAQRVQELESGLPSATGMVLNKQA